MVFEGWYLFDKEGGGFSILFIKLKCVINVDVDLFLKYYIDKI